MFGDTLKFLRFMLLSGYSILSFLSPPQKGTVSSFALKFYLVAILFSGRGCNGWILIIGRLGVYGTCFLCDMYSLDWELRRDETRSDETSTQRTGMVRKGKGRDQARPDGWERVDDVNGTGWDGIAGQDRNAARAMVPEEMDLKRGTLKP